MRTATALAVLVVIALPALSSACATRAPVSYTPSRSATPAPVLHTASAQSAPAPAPQKNAEKQTDVRAITLLIDVGGLGLFDDERQEAEELIAAWAEAAGLKVVPVAHAAQVFRRARVGQHVDTGAACGIPLPRWRAAERWQSTLGAEGRLRANVSCDEKSDDCVLVVSASNDVGFGGDRLLVRSAPFDPSRPWRTSLAAAVQALAEPPPGGGGGGMAGILGGLGSGGVVEAKPERLGWRAWPAGASGGTQGDDDGFQNGLSFPRGNAPLRACFAQDSAGAELLLDVDRKGRVARCESREAEDEVSRCACAAFTRHARAKPPLRSRRAYVGLHFDPADVVTAANAVVTASVHTYLEAYRGREGQPLFRPSVSDRSVEAWRPPADDALARCFADATELGAKAALVTVRFDEKGAASVVEVADTKADEPASPLSHEQQACLQRAFSTARAPCPAARATSARAQVSVNVRRIGEKLRSLSDVLGQ